MKTTSWQFLEASKLVYKRKRARSFSYTLQRYLLNKISDFERWKNLSFFFFLENSSFSPGFMNPTDCTKDTVTVEGALHDERDTIKIDDPCSNHLKSGRHF